MKVEVVTPEDYTGDVIGDLNIHEPHVNVGTIGHIDPRQDDADGGDHEGGLSKHNPNIKFRSFDQIDNAPEERERGITIATAHVEYETAEPALRARRLPGPRRLHQEHDHRRGADGRRDPGGVGRRRPDAADPRAHPAGPPGRRAGARRVPEQGATSVDDAELLDLVEMEVRELLTKYEFPGDDIPIIRARRWAR
jgi:elongation factor Tu